LVIDRQHRVPLVGVAALRLQPKRLRTRSGPRDGGNRRAV